MLKIYNRAEYIYRKASYIMMTTTNENAQVGALKTMLQANQQLIELTIPQATQPDLTEPTKVELSWRLKATDEEHEILSKAATIIERNQKEGMEKLH